MLVSIQAKPGVALAARRCPGCAPAGSRLEGVEGLRLCSRPACREAARATLTYVYADSTAVLGPLATYPEPHCYDLCAPHANRLTVPSGWSLIRLQLPETPRQSSEATDELYALAHAVKEERPAAPEAKPAPRNSRGPRLDARPRLAVLPQDEEESGR